MMLIKGKSKKRIITIALLGVFLASPMTGMCYAAEILPDSSRQESVIAEQVQEDIQKTIPAVPEVTAAGISAADKLDKSDINNINNSDLLYNIDNQNPVTVPKEERISLMPEDYAILAQEAQPEMNDEEILVAQHQTLNLRPPVQLSKAQNETGEMKVNSNNESVINANMSIYQKKEALKNLMEKYGYANYRIRDALEYIDWEKRKSTDFAPSFYTFLKKGHLTYFEDNFKVLYQYAFDEKAMKNISDLTDEIKKYGYDYYTIKYALQYIDWEKRKSTDFAPSFYTFLKKGHLTYFENNRKFLYQYAFDEQTMKNISDLTVEMEKYGYIRDALEYIDWEKRKSTDFAPSFYTFLKKGHLKYFEDNFKVLYQYAFDEQTMKNISDLTEEMKKYGYANYCIEYALAYIDWEKRKSTDFAPSFYTFLKKGHLKYFALYSKFLYQYAFDEQAMKNISDLTDEMIKHGYCEDCIEYALEYIDWEKRKSTDFAPSFYTFLKNGHLKYLDNNYKFLYQYAFDEQVMKNMLDLTEEMKKHGYDEDSIKMALAHIDWKKSENDFEHIINILKLNYAFLSVLEHMDYNKSAVTYEILKVMKNNRIGTNCISEHSKEIYAAYDKIYNNEKITNKEKKLAKELKKIENSYKRHQTISNTKDVIGFCGFILVAVVTLPIWAPIVLIALLTWDGSWH